MTQSNRDKYGLPPRLFLYTLDQIADMLVVDSMKKFVHYEGRSVGIAPDDKLLARNIAPAGEKPEWRVEEYEFIRWMKHTGIIPMHRFPRRR
jgi:hypothetical protein